MDEGLRMPKQLGLVVGMLGMAFCDSCILSKHLSLAYAVHFAFLCSKPVRIGSTFFNLDQFAESNI